MKQKHILPFSLLLAPGKTLGAGNRYTIALRILRIVGIKETF